MPEPRPRRLYLDLDGVFFDFDVGVKIALGAYPHEIEDDEMWRALEQIPQFYRALPLMRGCWSLWAAFRHSSPIFLSGVPMPPGGYMAFAPQDKCWAVSRHFGDIPLITCASKDKALFCAPDDIIVDDRDKYADKWRAAGGFFIHHNPDDVTRTIDLVAACMDAGS